MLHPRVPVRAGIEEAVEDYVLRAGAHQRERCPDPDFSPLKLRQFKVLDEHLLLPWKDQTAGRSGCGHAPIVCRIPGVGQLE